MTSTEWKDEERFPARVSVKVPAFLRNYAKAANRRIEEYNDAQFAPHVVTVHGKSWPGKPAENLPVIHMPCSPLRTHAYEGVYARSKASESPADKVGDKRDALTGADRSVVCTSNAMETRASLSRLNTGVTLEPMESQPLTAMFCAGQRLEGQSAKIYGDAKKGIGATAKECSMQRNHGIPPSERRRVSINRTACANPTQTLALNKLYSSLKRMKSRRGEASMDDLATVASLNGTDSSFSRSFLNKFLGVRRSSCSQRSEHEEVYILLGGKSKPVRLQFKTDGLHLVSENEWGVDLKSREEILSKMDQESLALLEKFRERYRLKGRSPESIDKKLIQNSQFPWARHVVYKGGLYEEKDEILEKDSGSKLSIHVYLPNADGMGDEGSECSHR